MRCTGTDGTDRDISRLDLRFFSLAGAEGRKRDFENEVERYTFWT